MDRLFLFIASKWKFYFSNENGNSYTPSNLKSTQIVSEPEKIISRIEIHLI